MKIILYLVLFLIISRPYYVSGQNQKKEVVKEQQNKSGLDRVAEYVKAFVSIVSFAEQIEDYFVQKATQAEKKEIIGQIEFLQGDLANLLLQKRNLFDIVKNNQLNDFKLIREEMQRSITGARQRVNEINKICGSKYTKIASEINKQLDSDLDAKSNNVEKIIKDLTGKTTVNRDTLKSDFGKSVEIIGRSTNDLDVILIRLKSK